MATSNDATPVIACRLDALSLEERSRRAALAAGITSLATEIVELDDGYALRLAPEPLVAHDVLEWLMLESRCCPFLRLELSLEPDGGPLWARLRGGAAIKAFLAGAGLKARGGAMGVATAEHRSPTAR